MVQARPIVGAGFDLANPILFEIYSEVPGTEFYGPHSIYFQVLGEHGFVGLGLFLALGLATWRRSNKLTRQCTDRPGLEWVPRLMRMVQVSLWHSRSAARSSGCSTMIFRTISPQSSLVEIAVAPKQQIAPGRSNSASPAARARIVRVRRAPSQKILFQTHRTPTGFSRSRLRVES
jgi:hypothetical protein